MAGPGFLSVDPDVSELVRLVLRGNEPTTGHALNDAVAAHTMRAGGDPSRLQNPYARLFATSAGSAAVRAVGNESRTLELLSDLSVELMLQVFDERGASAKHVPDGRRYLGVPGLAEDVPVLLVLDPNVSSVSASRRATEEVRLESDRIIAAFERLRPFISDIVGTQAGDAFQGMAAENALEVLWISRPEVVVTRRPRMEPLCAPTPHLAVLRGNESSSVGVLCTAPDGVQGVTACYHGTGGPGTAVTVAGVAGTVWLADPVQDLVFVPSSHRSPLPPMHGRRGVRHRPAPSEAEPVRFDGAGTGQLTTTHIKSHDAGILRIRRTLQLKVQTPAHTNFGDSGSALVDDNDQIVAFGFERTGLGEAPQLTDWIWAENALAALGLTPI